MAIARYVELPFGAIHPVAPAKLRRARCPLQPASSSARSAIFDFERRRIPVSALPLVAQSLSVSLEELFGQVKQAARSKRGPASKLEQHLQRISALPKPRQRAVIDVIEAMLAQQGR